MQYNTFTLPNGIRLVHVHNFLEVAHCGLIINVGSRDESPEEHGIAHFIEHVIFKGTRKRKAYHILTLLENVGGELNAYTTKEETCIYASFLKRDYERAIELIADITFNSEFPEKELCKEKEVIVDEINSYKDNPSELIFDEFEEFLFPDSSIGRSILGKPKNIMKFTREDIMLFIRKNYHTNEMVFCSVGNIEFSKLKRLFVKYFDMVPENIRYRKLTSRLVYKAFSRELDKKTYQSHCLIGNIAYDIKDKRRAGLFLLNNILGGPGLNSRLNMSVREKNGYAYTIESMYNPYFDTGIFCVYFGTEKKNMGRSMELVYKEFSNLKGRKISTSQLKMAKRQLIGQLTISNENKESLMLSIGKNYLLFNKVDSLQEINKKIEAITAEELQEISNDIFDFGQLSTLIYK